MNRYLICICTTGGSLDDEEFSVYIVHVLHGFIDCANYGGENDATKVYDAVFDIVTELGLPSHGAVNFYAQERLTGDGTQSTCYEIIPLDKDLA